MAHVITQNCCKDATCVSVCPVNCIHPGPTEAGHHEAPMLYIDADACIDCGACVDACPIDAVVPADSLAPAEVVYADVNRDFYADRRPVAQRPEGSPLFRAWEPPSFDWALPGDFRAPDVAVVGTGPAGMYAVDHLLRHTDARITLVDRLEVAGGLVRYGVAPDHPATRRIDATFARLRDHPRVEVCLGVEVGRDVSTDQVAEHFGAVVYAVGASVGRGLGVPGEDLPGSVPGPRAVGWYTGHPDVPADAVPTDHPRAVVVGTGNVALDVARVLTGDPDGLRATDAARHAVDAIASGSLREVVLLGRRGPEHAAWTAPELRALVARAAEVGGVEVVLDETGPTDAGDLAGPGSSASLLADLPRRRVDLAGPPEPGRRVVLRFDARVAELRGNRRVEEVVLDDGARVTAGLLVSAVGHRGAPVPGLPFDEATGTVPHEAGRVVGRPGTYVTGWIKRGSSGGIGDNRADAAETVRTLLADATAGALPRPPRSRRGFHRTARRLRRTTP
ncbi:FAD-dependent oxidoreductase [Nocardioides lentus]|uniref:ferredoxin--NADP(+) reductase n=1 Tax=Nocardioides lentus TaxID=338077 RepID=A0ABP5B5G8_9ACTN